MKLEVGKKYRLPKWIKDHWVRVIDLGRNDFWGDDHDGNKCSWVIGVDWEPYSEPALDDTELWAWALCLDGANKKWYWANITMWHTEKSVRDEFPEAKGYRKLEALGSIRRED